MRCMTSQHIHITPHREEPIMTATTDFATRLAQLRHSRKYSANSLAAAVNELANTNLTSRICISRTEHHLRRYIPLAEATLMAKVLKIRPEKLLFSGDDPSALSPFVEYQGLTNHQARTKWRLQDADKPIRVGSKRRASRPNRGVARMELHGEDVILAKYRSVASAVRWLRGHGVPTAVPANISLACQGKRKSAYGYRWCYVPEVTRRVVDSS